MIKRMIRYILGDRIIRFINRLRCIPERAAKPYFAYDMYRCVKYSGAFAPLTRGKMLARVIIAYHVVEKGLTMPNRRFSFGKKAVCTLMDRIGEFERRFGASDGQINHAAGVVKAYWDMHTTVAKQNPEDKEYWDKIYEFIVRHEYVPVAAQPHVTRKEFYKDRLSGFPAFAKARHTIRHYSGSQLSDDKIKASVEITRYTPSACNRQYCRVCCLSDKMKIEQLLAIQGGCRGFGHLADKLLIVVADLEGICGVQERNDVFTNGGMFLMNLCYALHYNEVAHCILNWSRTPGDDIKMRQIIKIKPSESVIAILTCGEAPDEFDVAMSPRKEVCELLEFLD